MNVTNVTPTRDHYDCITIAIKMHSHVTLYTWQLFFFLIIISFPFICICLFLQFTLGPELPLIFPFLEHVIYALCMRLSFHSIDTALHSNA